MRQKLRKRKGITLISLVITIIVMLILVGVTINIAVNGGLFGYAGKATKDTSFYRDDEKLQTIYATAEISKYLNDGKSFSDEVKKEFGQETIVEKNGDGTYVVILENEEKHIVGKALDNVIVELNDVEPGVTHSTGDNAIKVYGYDISLAGDIAIDIYLDIPEERFSNSNQNVIKITNSNRDDSQEDYKKEETIEIKKEKFLTKAIDDKTYYCIKYKLLAKEMADNITLSVYNGEAENYSFSMRSIANTVLGMNDNQETKINKYIKLLLLYGGYTQKNAGYNTSEVASDGIETTEDTAKLWNTMNEITNLNYNFESDCNSEYIRRPSCSLQYTSMVNLAYTFMRNNKDENYIGYCNDEKGNLTINSYGVLNLYKEVSFENFYSEYVGKVYNSNNEEVASFKCSVIERIKDIINDQGSSESRKLSVASLYLAQKAYMDLIS